MTDLAQVLRHLPPADAPELTVGSHPADDAAVYRMRDDLAMVQSLDFFTPIVDDPFTFGQIAATNSLSDVYAMGGRPLTALAMVCFPEKGNLEILERILAGGLSKMIEAGCTVIGGHSIRDDETKFGYSVTGVIDPRRVLKNGGARPGDRLIFTKALGTGVISTAIKKGVAKQSWIDAAVASMTTLNKTAAEVITSARGEAGVLARQAERSSATAFADDRRPTTDDTFPVHALTDVTGFGLVGHLREMLLASEGASATLHSSRIPLLDGTVECIHAGHIPGGLNANRDFAECMVNYKADVPDEIRTVLFDPQTAGGLLAAVAPESAKQLLDALRTAGVPAHEIGEITAASHPGIHVTR